MLTKRRSDSAILLTFLVEMSATRVVASPITMEVAASTLPVRLRTRRWRAMRERET